MRDFKHGDIVRFKGLLFNSCGFNSPNGYFVRASDLPLTTKFKLNIVGCHTYLTPLDDALIFSNSSSLPFDYLQDYIKLACTPLLRRRNGI